MGLVITLIVVFATLAFNVWRNHSTGKLYMRQGPVAERKTEPVVFWGCQGVLALLAVACLVGIAVVFGSG
ncbi:MAG: hypothetical protein ABL871_12540 [Terricaulis sp.]